MGGAVAKQFEIDKKLSMVEDLIGKDITKKKPGHNKIKIKKSEVESENKTAEKIMEETLAELDASDEVKEYLDKLGTDIEVVVSGATNKVALMAAGTIPASFRDLALVFNKISIAAKQLDQLQKLVRDTIVADPTAPDAFSVGDLTFTYDTITTTVLDTSEWKKKDPVGYNAVKLMYSKAQPRTTFRVTATKARDFSKGVNL